MSRRWRFAFVYEDSQGHVTFARHLRQVAEADPDIDGAWYPIGLGIEDRLEQLPPFRQNLSMRMSLRARRRLHGGVYDAVLFHTQQSALLSGGLMARTPTVLSIDATPENVDQYAEVYGKTVGRSVPEELKRRMTARTIGRASRIITWSDWCARSVIATYEADPGKVKVIFPGIPLERWEPRQHRRPGPVRLLFVGTKFVRKGGRHLFDALREVSGAWEIHVVNRDDDIPDDGRTVVHRGLSPDDGSLVEIYRQADIFVLPTIGDALPMALLEAMAVGLPVIATRVGGIPEVVREGETGMLVEVGDVDGLAAAIQTLVNDPALRVAMGVAGRRLALARHDASRVYLGHLDAMKEVADRSSGR